MTPADTELTDPPGPMVCLEAVALVLDYPGCTIGELAARTKAGQNEHRREVVRLALLPALQQGVERGHLVTGARRECRVRGVTTTTWMPGATFDRPMLPERGLRGLVSKALRAVKEAAQ